MGRQPTSGYCETCRKRRVKCDKGRPHCGRCLASGYPCRGYDLPLRMQVLGLHSERDGTQRLVRVLPLQPSLGHVPMRLRDSREHQQAASSYFFATFNWGPFWRPLILSATNGDFFETNKVCFQAITDGYMGLGLGDSALRARGGQLYGRVLSEVQTLLLQPAKCRLAKLGYTMIMMTMYEFAMNKVIGRIPPHHVGIAQIVQYCGPETFQQESLLEVYRSCREMLLCQSLCLQRRCFLEDRVWKTLPWQQLPKTLEDRLKDIFIDLPGLAEAVVSPHKRAACLESVNTLFAALHEWRWDWHAVHSTSVRSVRHTSSLETKGTKTTPDIVSLMLLVSLEFDSPRLALDILYYNAAILYLMQIEAVARGEVPPQPEILAPDGERYVRRYVAAAMSGNGQPLLQPGAARFRCQAAAEAFMTISCATQLLATTPETETVVTPSAVGILYWVLRDQLQLEHDCLASLLSKHAIFDDAPGVFTGFFVKVG